MDASTGTTWFYPSGTPHLPVGAGVTSLAETNLRFTLDDPWWARMAAVTLRRGRALGESRCDRPHRSGGNLDILASLRDTQQLLLDLYRHPDEVDRLARQITPLWLRYYDGFSPGGRHQPRHCWSPLWAPVSYMLQSDFSYMISRGCSSA